MTSPSAWAALYDDPERGQRGFVFRRGVVLASEACLRHAKAGDRWLDAGCGPGHLAVLLARAGVHIVGVDIDRAMLGHARDRVRCAGVAGTFEPVAGDACGLPLATSSVDGVIATSLAGCLPDLRGLLSEAHRVLKPSGRLVLTFTNRSSLLLRLNALLGRIEQRLTGAPADTCHYHLYASREIETMLREEGFRLDGSRLYNYVVNLGAALVPPAGLCMRLDRDGDDSRLARNLLIVAGRAELR